MRALETRLGEEYAVIGYDADGLPVDLREPGYQRGAVAGLEFGKGGPVDDAGDNFVGGDLAAERWGGRVVR